MRYVMLLICLVSFTSAYAYNEVVSAIAYNPSRLGAYSYLKILKTATLKAGLGTTGNATEINLYGNSITLSDLQTGQNHKINSIKALSNYVVDGTDKTFSDSSALWVQNTNASMGDATVNLDKAWLTGQSLNIANLWNTYQNTTEEDSILETVTTIPIVTMYGGQLKTSDSSSKKGISVIRGIKGLDLSSTSPRQEELNTLPTNFLRIEAPQAIVNGANESSMYVTGTLTLKGMNIAVDSLVCPSGSASYDWKERITDSHVKYHVLARECN